MMQSHHCHVLVFLALALVVVATKETSAFLVMTGQAVRLTKPPLPTNAAMTSTTRRSAASPLHYRNRDDEAETQVTVKSNRKLSTTSTAPGLRIPIVGAIAMSQVMTLTVASLIVAGALFSTGNSVDLNAIHWNWGNEFHSLFDFTLTPWRLFEGVLAATPMIYVGTIVEGSDHRDSSHVNFSTMNAVMTLFGRRRHLWGDNKSTKEHHHPEIPETYMPQVLFVVAAIALLTGFAEEIVFRGEIPFLIAFFSHSPMLALLGQSLLFGAGHLSRRATAGENRIVSGLQSLNGLWYGLIYLLAGGDVLPCIVAHTLYDSHVFMETWMRINDQMDYTDEAATRSPSKGEQDEIDLIQKEAGPQLMTEESLDFTRRFFYAFDYEHKGSLSRSDLQRAVSYAFLQDSVQPTQARVNKLFDKALQRRKAREEDERLSLGDFLRILVVLKGSPNGACT